MYVFVLNNGRDDICSCGSRPRAKKGGVGGKVDLLALLAFLLSVISSFLPTVIERKFYKKTNKNKQPIKKNRFL